MLNGENGKPVGMVKFIPPIVRGIAKGCRIK